MTATSSVVPELFSVRCVLRAFAHKFIGLLTDGCWNLYQVSVRLAIYFDQQMTKMGGSGGQEAPAPAPVTLVCPVAVSPLNTSSGLNPINTDTEPPNIGNMVIIYSPLLSAKCWPAQFSLKRSQLWVSVPLSWACPRCRCRCASWAGCSWSTPGPPCSTGCS